MGTISAASGHVPVQMLSASWPKLPDDGNSFGSDFQRLGSVATSTLAPIGKAWQTYPARQRSDLENSGISLGRWCGERDRDLLAANRLKAHPLMPQCVGETLERWRTTYLDAIGKDVSFERDRSTAMQSMRNRTSLAVGSMPREARHYAKPFVRTFDVSPVRAQLTQIAPLHDEIRKLDATLQLLPEGEGKRIARGNRDDLVALRNAMVSLTLDAHERKRDELKVETRKLIALNDMAREAEREMSNGGADVPLRLSVRNGNWVLKPAASTSWFSKNKTRAANDAARLALLLGYPADQRVSLKMIRDRGFGAYEYSTVLNDARAAGQGNTRSWLATRALDIDMAKTAGSTVADDVAKAFEHRPLGDTPEPAQEDDLFDENHYALLSLNTSERSGRAQASAQVHGEGDDAVSRRPVGEARTNRTFAAPAHDDTRFDEDESEEESTVPHFRVPDGAQYVRMTWDETSSASTRRPRMPSAVRFAEALDVARSSDTQEGSPPLPSRALPPPPLRPTSLRSSPPPSFPPPPLPPIDE
ncbi:hypothetical protein [Pandoraea fibrosis]|uniref:Uncharacterized protein n=1 Tax=Pandoraea fibrosis TaxID=1891094 RepID=A0A5E4SRG0_9BURK|nr:hypothetical protein [Pandoraea fibrosis]VVD77711.1 hypothetical protein PFI31113_00943 [Pandoraea fibrosis]